MPDGEDRRLGRTLLRGTSRNQTVTPKTKLEGRNARH